MKLLLDHNLSPRLTHRLADLYPGAIHVVDVGLERSDDVAIWQYAGLHGLIIVTKDVDFTELSLIRTGSPKVIWIRRGKLFHRGHRTDS
jgi:predicted nuclease of predicted toxin-antitoxin system